MKWDIRIAQLVESLDQGRMILDPSYIYAECLLRNWALRIIPRPTTPKILGLG